MRSRVELFQRGSKRFCKYRHMNCDSNFLDEFYLIEKKPQIDRVYKIGTLVDEYAFNISPLTDNYVDSTSVKFMHGHRVYCFATRIFNLDSSYDLYSF